MVPSRVETVPLVAGRPVLDLVNTVSWRGDEGRAEDHLQEPDHCLSWAHRSGVLDQAELDALRRRLAERPETGATLTRGLRRLRTVVADAVLEPAPPALAAAAASIREARQHSHLGPGPGRPYAWRVTDLDEHTVRRRLALDLEALLTSAEGRIGECADPACRWVFLDTSRGHRRQWCSSTDCGNRSRVQRHYERVRPRTSRPRTAITTAETTIAATDEPSQVGGVKRMAASIPVHRSAQPGTSPG